MLHLTPRMGSLIDRSEISFRWFAAVVLICSQGLAFAAGEVAVKNSGEYPRRELLAEASEFEPNKSVARVVLDTREKEKYIEGHIPNAIWVDATSWSKAVSEDQDPSNWTRRFAELGIDSESDVIVYDDQRLRVAARTWWILRLWGVERPSVLNGGWDAYVHSSKVIEKGAGQPPRPGTLIAKREAKVLATKDLLLTAYHAGRLGKSGPGDLQLIDTRSDAEYCGTESTGRTRAKRVGTIPGAKHLEWSELLVPNSSYLKSVDDLKKLFSSVGVDVHQPAATFCQGGGRAAVMAFGLELMGSPEARNYYASWGEWGNAEDTPVEKPQ